jgi:hypothetical protein
MGAAAVQATTVTSSTFSSWNTDLTGAPTEADFTQISFTNYNSSSGLTLSASGNPSVTFNLTGPDGADNWALTGALYDNFVSIEGGSNNSASIDIALPGSAEDALLLSLASTLGDPISVDLSDGETFTLAGNGLLGLSISHPITWLTVSTGAVSQAVIDDFWYGNSSLAQDGSGSDSGYESDDETSPTPECVSLLLVAGGLFVLLGAHRKLNLANAKPAV